MNTAKKSRAMALLLAIAGAGFAPAAAAQVRVVEAWAGATAAGEKVAAAYVTLANPGSEERKLLKIVSPVADEIMLHRTNINHEGVARMWPMAVLAVEAGQTLRMDPKGLHVMLGKLRSPLVAGQKVPLTLKFDGGEPEFTVMIDVRPLVSTAEAHARHP